MTQRLAQDEVRELVSDAQTKGLWNIEVAQNPIVLAHTQAEAERGHGRTVEEGYKGTIKTLNRGESVWAKAIDGTAEVSIARSGFDISLEPRIQTFGFGEDDLSRSYVLSYEVAATVAAGSDSGWKTIAENTDTETKAVHKVTCWSDSTSANVKVELRARSPSGPDNQYFTDYRLVYNLGDFPVDGPVPLPASDGNSGTRLEYRVTNNLSSSIDVELAALQSNF